MVCRARSRGDLLTAALPQARHGRTEGYRHVRQVHTRHRIPKCGRLRPWRPESQAHLGDEWLMEKGQIEEYLRRLVNAFNPSTVAGLMCRNTLSVSWDGYLFDCDFNQQLEMHMDFADGSRPHVSEFDLEAWKQHSIRTHRHCYGCTAGAGSGCRGAIELDKISALRETDSKPT
ncbi:MAG: DUF3641 domain-containing protein [Rhodothermales bacterium]